MKKFLFFIFFFTYSFSCGAHMAHYSKFNKIEMEILKDGEVIGYNYYFFKKDKNKTTVTNQIKFTVKLFGATVFEIEGYGEEKYVKDKLISFNSKTRQNNKDKYVNLKLNEQENIFNIKGSSYSGKVSADNIVGNWWNHKILKVNKNIIKKYGAVSKECCKSMVQNLSKISKSKINVSITGIAGPGGASKDKPVGLVYIGIKMGKYLLILENKFKPKNRNSIQKSTVQKVIKIILIFC